MPEEHSDPTPGEPPHDGPMFTVFHLTWLTLAAAAAAEVFIGTTSSATFVRVLVAAVAFVVALPAVHLLMVIIVTWLVIPRLAPGSYWSREVDSYMASVFPGQWPR